GAASIASYALNSPPKRSAPILVSAAVSVVLPWSTWPMVPTFTCGLVRSNLPLDIGAKPLELGFFLEDGATQGMAPPDMCAPGGAAGYAFLITVSAMLFGASS